MTDLTFARNPGIPEGIYAALKLWVENRVMPGSFTRACLENNLSEAIAHADDNSYAALREIVGFIYWELPGNCWGSPEQVAAWRGQYALRMESGMQTAAEEIAMADAFSIDMDTAPCWICCGADHATSKCQHGSLDS